jgi:hypothetical protein
MDSNRFAEILPWQKLQKEIYTSKDRKFPKILKFAAQNSKNIFQKTFLPLDMMGATCDSKSLISSSGLLEIAI